MTRAPFSLVVAALIRVGLVLFVLATLSSHAAEPKRILMLHSFGRATSPYDSASSTFRDAMLDAWPGQVAFYDFALESGRPVQGVFNLSQRVPRSDAAHNAKTAKWEGA